MTTCQKNLAAARVVERVPLSPDVFVDTDWTLYEPVNLLCITLYNEAFEELEATIISTVLSLKRFHDVSSNANDLSAICIIADGTATLNPAIRNAFDEWGFLPGQGAVDAEGTVTYSTVHDTDDILARLRPGISTLPGGKSSRIAVFVAIKLVNWGKLHSHKLFFSRFCRWLNPTYCYQIDAGTTLDAELIRLLADQMHRRPNIGGVAPQVTPAAPLPADSFLAKWQFFDFAFRACIEWPFEVLTGYLSVLPGQVCAFRWRALHGTVPGRENTLGSDSPIQRYLDGMETASPIDRIRYLAEDRVIGASLIFAPESRWQLAYVPQAVGITDRCNSFMELLRQRRRWNNSSMLARYWLLRQVPGYVRRDDRTRAQKARLLVSVAGQLLIGCRDLFSPAFLGALVMVLGQQCFAASTALGRVACISFFAIAALDVTLNMYSAATSERRARLLTPGLRALSFSCPLFFLAAVASFSWPVCLLLLVPALALIPSVLSLPRRSFWTMLRQQLSPITMLTMAFAVSVYALLRMDDVSWGTKGLSRADVREPLRRGLVRLRNLVVGWWVASNVALLALAVATQGEEINVLTATICAVDGLLAVGGLVYVMYGRRS